MDIAKCRTIVRAHNSLLRRFGSIVLVSLCLITNANAKARDNSNGNIFTPQDEKQERPNEPLPEAIVTTKSAKPDELMSED